MIMLHLSSIWSHYDAKSITHLSFSNDAGWYWLEFLLIVKYFALDQWTVTTTNVGILHTKLKSILNENKISFTHEYAYHYIICKMRAMLFRTLCVYERMNITLKITITNGHHSSKIIFLTNDIIVWCRHAFIFGIRLFIETEVMK